MSTQAAQAIDGYLCNCGFKALDLDDFRRHFFDPKIKADNKANPGTHKSAGRYNPSSGEVTMGPYNARTKEQKDATRHGRKIENSDKTAKLPSKTPTEILSDATEIKVVPRVFTMDYSPIMRSAQEAAIREWKWRQDMPLGNFLDTVLYNFFREHGIKLTAYVVEVDESKGG